MSGAALGKRLLRPGLDQTWQPETARANDSSKIDGLLQALLQLLPTSSQPVLMKGKGSLTAEKQGMANHTANLNHASLMLTCCVRQSYVKLLNCPQENTQHF